VRPANPDGKVGRRGRESPETNGLRLAFDEQGVFFFEQGNELMGHPFVEPSVEVDADILTQRTDLSHAFHAP